MLRPSGNAGQRLTTAEVFVLTSFRRTGAVVPCSQTGLVNNLSDDSRPGPVPRRLRRAHGSDDRTDQHFCGPLPALWGLGQLVTGGSVRSARPEVAHRRRNAHAGRRDRVDRFHDRLRTVGDRRRSPRCRHGNGVSHAARSRWRRRASTLARPCRRRVSTLARPGLRGRCAPRRHPRRRVRNQDRDLDGRGSDRVVRCDRRRAHVRDPPAASSDALRAKGPTLRLCGRCSGRARTTLGTAGSQRREPIPGCPARSVRGPRAKPACDLHERPPMGASYQSRDAEVIVVARRGHMRRNHRASAPRPPAPTDATGSRGPVRRAAGWQAASP